MQLYRDKFNCFVEVEVEGVDCKASLALTFAVIFEFNLFKTKSGRGLIRPAQSIDPKVRKTSVKKREKRENCCLFVCVVYAIFSQSADDFHFTHTHTQPHTFSYLS